MTVSTLELSSEEQAGYIRKLPTLEAVRRLCQIMQQIEEDPLLNTTEQCSPSITEEVLAESQPYLTPSVQVQNRRDNRIDPSDCRDSHQPRGSNNYRDSYQPDNSSSSYQDNYQQISSSNKYRDSYQADNRSSSNRDGYQADNRSSSYRDGYQADNRNSSNRDSYQQSSSSKHRYNYQPDNSSSSYRDSSQQTSSSKYRDNHQMGGSSSGHQDNYQQGGSNDKYRDSYRPDDSSSNYQDNRQQEERDREQVDDSADRVTKEVGMTSTKQEPVNSNSLIPLVRRCTTIRTNERAPQYQIIAGDGMRQEQVSTAFPSVKQRPRMMREAQEGMCEFYRDVLFVTTDVKHPKWWYSLANHPTVALPFPPNVTTMAKRFCELVVLTDYSRVQQPNSTEILNLTTDVLVDLSIAANCIQWQLHNIEFELQRVGKRKGPLVVHHRALNNSERYRFQQMSHKNDDWSIVNDRIANPEEIPCGWGMRSPWLPEYQALFRLADVGIEAAVRLVSAIPADEPNPQQSVLHNQLSRIVEVARERLQSQQFCPIPHYPLRVRQHILNTLWKFEHAEATPYSLVFDPLANREPTCYSPRPDWTQAREIVTQINQRSEAHQVVIRQMANNLKHLRARTIGVAQIGEDYQPNNSQKLDESGRAQRRVLIISRQSVLDRLRWVQDRMMQALMIQNGGQRAWRLPSEVELYGRAADDSDSAFVRPAASENIWFWTRRDWELVKNITSPLEPSLTSFQSPLYYEFYKVVRDAQEGYAYAISVVAAFPRARDAVAVSLALEHLSRAIAQARQDSTKRGLLPDENKPRHDLRLFKRAPPEERVEVLTAKVLADPWEDGNTTDEESNEEEQEGDDGNQQPEGGKTEEQLAKQTGDKATE